jgi:inner membrane protein
VNFRLVLKLLALFFIFLLLLAPVSQIRDLVRERQQTRDGVVTEMARGAGYAQTITGPLLLVPYTKKVRTTVEATKDVPRHIEESIVEGELAFLPDTFTLSSELTLSERERGIYRARVYHAKNKLVGEFRIPPHFGIRENLPDYTFGASTLAVGISDIRGIANGLDLVWNGTSFPVSPGTKTALVSSGVHAALTLPNAQNETSLPFSLQLQLQGTGDFQVVPVGRDSRVEIKSNWPHPSFVGEFLPRGRSISNQGFTAQWQTSFFATNLEEALARCHGSSGDAANCNDFHSRRFGVNFIDPVDQYLKTERASKYAVLFIGLTFAAFFLVEVLRQKSVHPIQYGLVGLALAVFFLLLLALAEHLGFARAYALSSLACITLVSFYAAHVLQNGKALALFSSALLGLYAVLFAILSSEDYALLAGSLLVFCVLGLVMVLTRKVDWSTFGRSTSSPKEHIDLSPLRPDGPLSPNAP